VGAAGTASAEASRSVGDFTGWANPHLSAMSRLATRLAGEADRDDIVQEALTAAWQKWETYDDSRGSPRSWLLAIVADQSRKSRRRRRVVVAVDDAGAGAYTDQPADLDLERAIRTLPPRQRLALELHYFLDLPVADVAAVMGCAVGTVKATLSHGRARLHRELGEEFR
jgi:RNA polymerase sigma-70 factor (ECF subfamily)